MESGTQRRSLSASRAPFPFVPCIVCFFFATSVLSRHTIFHSGSVEHSGRQSLGFMISITKV